MEIRDAVQSDSVAACAVLRRSIIELCTRDHDNNPVVLASWLVNKTPEIIAGWIDRPNQSIMLAVEEDRILAVGAVTDAGKIILNYVSPDARFRGVSKALLCALETRAAARGSARCTLDSTVTARRFYAAAGYAEFGPPITMFGTPSYPMSKHLSL